MARIEYSKAWAKPLTSKGIGTFARVLPEIEERPKINAIHKIAGGQPRKKDGDLMFMRPLVIAKLESGLLGLPGAIVAPMPRLVGDSFLKTLGIG